MANIFKKFIEVMRVPDDEGYDDDFYEEDEEEEAVSFPSRNKKSSKAKVEDDFDDDDFEQPKKERFTKVEKGPKLVPMQSGRRRGGMGVSIHNPKSIDDSEQICDMLIRGNAVIVNLEGLNSFDAQRIMDFLSGCIYAMDGKYNQVSKYIFIFSPNNVDVSSEMEFATTGVPTFSREY